MNNQQQMMLERYQRAQQLEQGVCTKRVAFNTTLYPQWIGDSDCFRYEREQKDGGTERIKVDARTGERQRLEPETVLNAADGENDALPSPDGTKALFVRDYNLWLRDQESGEENPLTTDGEHFHVYGSSPTVYGRQEAPLVDAVWSADSKRVLTQLIDTRDVSTGVPLVRHVPTDGSVRPNILNPERRVAVPGDDGDEAWQFVAIDLASGQMMKSDCPPCPVSYPPYAGFFVAGRGWWGADGRHAYLIHLNHDGRKLQLLRWDTEGGDIKVLIEETSDTPLTLIPISHIKTLMLPLPESNELIWYSERSGWAHFYLYELSTGTLKHPITRGDWLVRNLLHFDAVRRELWVQTAGREPTRNPYYSDICRVNIDSGELVPVVSTDDEYTVCDGRSRIAYFHPNARGVSPSGDYVVTTRSRVDRVPETLLLDRNGNEVFTLETADVSGLPDHWQWPEPVMLKTADGEQDVYAVVFRPSDFDPNKSYPVLDCSYWYSAPVGSFTNNSTGDWHYLSASAYAELGFITVMLNNRGNFEVGLRDTAFIDYKDTDLPPWNKVDAVAAIRQLAERYPSMDINRVGVAEFGSIPMALTGMLVHPDFYKVGVSINPLADYRVYATLPGLLQGDYPPYEQFAPHLRGKLLLVHGMLDDVIPVSSTLRIVEALHKANKNFDMLLLPNLGHSTNGYVTRRAWDYFVEHLLGEMPPKEFSLTTGLDLLMAAMTPSTTE